MIRGFEIKDEKNYSIEHIYDSQDNEKLIQNFQVDKQSAKGLEQFLKYWAMPSMKRETDTATL